MDEFGRIAPRSRRPAAFGIHIGDDAHEAARVALAERGRIGSECGKTGGRLESFCLRAIFVQADARQFQRGIGDFGYGVVIATARFRRDNIGNRHRGFGQSMIGSHRRIRDIADRINR